MLNDDVAMRAVKLVVAGSLLVIFLWYGAFIITKDFGDYRDSPAITYLTIGGTSLVVSALLALSAGAWYARRRSIR